MGHLSRSEVLALPQEFQRPGLVLVLGVEGYMVFQWRSPWLVAVGCFVTFFFVRGMVG